MTSAEATEAIKAILIKCQGTTTVVVALIADEDDENVRIMHPLLSDKMCADLMRTVAGRLDLGDA